MGTCDAASHRGHVYRLAPEELLEHTLEALRVAPVAHRSPQALLRERQLPSEQPLKQDSLAWNLREVFHTLRISKVVGMHTQESHLSFMHGTLLWTGPGVGLALTTSDS